MMEIPKEIYKKLEVLNAIDERDENFKMVINYQILYNTDNHFGIKFFLDDKSSRTFKDSDIIDLNTFENLLSKYKYVALRTKEVCILDKELRCSTH